MKKPSPSLPISGSTAMLLSADYPYYRDTPQRWEARLGSLRAMGITTLTCYLPWRHHQPQASQPPDFDGHTQPNRNVIGFLQLCQQNGLKVIIKPGPFIHAETNYGGLPDWVCPRFAPIEPIRDARGRERFWSGAELDPQNNAPRNWPLPAPFDPFFLSQVQTWMRAVRERILELFSAPQGNIVAVQIGNEGIYSDGQAAPWEYDYSLSGIAQFHRYLQEKYTHLSALQAAYGRPDLRRWDEVLPPRPADARSQPPQLLRDWGEFQAWYLGEIFRQWAAPLQTNLPILLNQNPPLEAPYGLDAWLTRVEPERWHGLTYGFTNWVGDVSAKPSAFDRYALTARRYPGFNMEENWGFAALYDAAYADPSTSFYQTLLILNAGALGFNVYTGVATGVFDPNLTVLPQSPYPDCPPIPLSGEWTPKAEIVRWLIDFFTRYGVAFAESRPLQPLAWGFSLHSVRVDVWKPEEQPRHGAYLAAFMQAARQVNRPYDLLNLDAVPPEKLYAYAQIYVAAPGGLSPQAESALRHYLEHGGQVIWLGPLTATSLNGQFTPQSSLQIAAPDYLKVQGQADVWARRHPQRDEWFITLLPGPHTTEPVEVHLKDQEKDYRLRVHAAAGGGCVLRLSEGKVTDFLLKGVNLFLNHQVVPLLEVNEQCYTASAPGDLALRDGQMLNLPAAGRLPHPKYP